jgi:ABC-type bacteriocin/lantibiotic exporter with double-glycine peptidase domain
MQSIILSIRKSLSLLNNQDRKKVYFSIALFTSLSILELTGVILLGTLGTIAYNSVSGINQPTRLEQVISNLINIDISRNTFVLAVSIIALTSIATKIILQAFFTIKFAKYLSRIQTTISTQLYRQILKSNIVKINSYKYSDYNYSLNAGTEVVISTCIGGFINFWSDFLTTLLLFMFAFYASPISVLAILLIFSVILLLINKKINVKSKLYGTLSRRSNLNLSENLLESYRGIREIKSYHIEETYSELFNLNKKNDSYANQMRKVLNQLIRYLFEFAILISATVVAFILLISTDSKNAVTVAIIFIAIGFRLIPNIQRLHTSWTSLKIAEELASPFFKQYEDFLQNKESESLHLFSNAKICSIKVSNLSFKFTGYENILENVNFELQAKQVFIIWGESGSGKSTLLDLVAGLYEPTHGSISYSVLDYDKLLPAGSLPISYISQSNSLFGKNLYENITLKRELSEKDILVTNNIIKILNLDKFKYDNFGESREVRSDHTNISGGERQRISIGRAMYFDTDLVFLDEPTSAIDEENRDKIYGYIESIKNTKTIIIATHDENLLKYADTILVIKQKQIKFYHSISEFEDSKN